MWSDSISMLVIHVLGQSVNSCFRQFGQLLFGSLSAVLDIVSYGEN